MKRIALIYGLAALLAGASVAQASCNTTGCLSKQVKSLKTQLTKVEKVLAILTGCLGEAPVTRYGDTTGHAFGYVYDAGSGATPTNTTALDGTATGHNVSAWLLFDRCNRKTTPSAKDVAPVAPARDASQNPDAWALSPFGPIAPQFALRVFPLTG
jgi:hypothetical protein